MADPRLTKLIQKRDREIDGGADSFEEELLRLSDNLGRRLAASLGVDPDLIAPRDGDDGILVGATNFERLLQDITDTDAIIAAVTSSSLSEIEDFIDAAGLGDAREEIRARVARLAGMAEESLSIQGVVAAEGALDTIAAEALMEGFFNTQIEESLLGTMSRQSAVRIKSAIISNLALESVEEVARRIVDAENASIGRAKTEARTRLQMADRTAHDVLRKTVEETGQKFLLAYMGPKPDKIIRPFCKELVGGRGSPGRAYKIEDFNNANNNQTPEHPRIAGGGYNCRHYVQAVLDDDDVLKSLGLERGSIQDIRAANRAARSKKKKGRK